jgi:hypothetical protein
MDELDEQLAQIGALDGPAYRDAPLPSADDELFTAALRRIAAMPSPERALRAEALARLPVYRRLETYIIRRCILAVRTASTQAVREAAMALALEGCVNRGTYMMVMVVWDAAQRLDLDGDAVLRDAARDLATPRGQAKIEEVVSQKAKSLANTGWRALETPQGIYYRFGTYPRTGETR